MEARMEALTTHLSGFAVAVVLRVARYSSALFEFRFGLGGVAIFLCGRRGGTVLSVLSVVCLVLHGRNVIGRRVRGNGLRRLLRGRRRGCGDNCWRYRGRGGRRRLLRVSVSAPEQGRQEQEEAQQQDGQRQRCGSLRLG